MEFSGENSGESGGVSRVLCVCRLTREWHIVTGGRLCALCIVGGADCDGGSSASGGILKCRSCCYLGVRWTEQEMIALKRQLVTDHSRGEGLLRATCRVGSSEFGERCEERGKEEGRMGQSKQA